MGRERWETSQERFVLSHQQTLANGKSTGGAALCKTNLCITLRRTGKNSVFLYSGDEDVFLLGLFTLQRQRNIRKVNHCREKQCVLLPYYLHPVSQNYPTSLRWWCGEESIEVKVLVAGPASPGAIRPLTLLRGRSGKDQKHKARQANVKFC